ncbi:MAG: response regulator [bacterium]
MMNDKGIRVLIVEDNIDFAKLVKIYLERFEGYNFSVIWKESGQEGIEEADRNREIDVILMDYYLPGLNGLEVTKILKSKSIEAPIIFLTVNTDMNLAVEVMKLGVQDYLVKEEISTPILPTTIIRVVERQKFKRDVAELEIKKKRLEAMQELVLEISDEISIPLLNMKQLIESLGPEDPTEKKGKYISIINDNIIRIGTKMQKLHNLKEDRTVQYIKDIKMIDLS